nr:ribonuclease H-like domain-containing protein [Tanacetum cinerariifolium]
MVTRSQSGIVKPLERFSLHAASISPIPKTPFVALQNSHWRQAMLDNYNALIKNGYALRARFYHSRCDTSLFIYQQGSQSSTGLFLSLKKYACELLERANMVNYNPLRTPVDTDSKLGPEGVTVQDPTLYRSLAGGLQYLTFTRPDLSYVVQQICLYMHDPREPHFVALKRILRYVRGIVEFGLQLYASATTSLVGYTDADWTGCDNLLSWSSMRQHTISRSSAEEKHRGVANVVAETTWLRNLLRELHSPLSIATLVYCDNVSVVYLSANPVQHQRTKHIEIDIHFVCDMVQTGHIRVLYVPSRYQYAHIFTKVKLTSYNNVSPRSLSLTPLFNNVSHVVHPDTSAILENMAAGLTESDIVERVGRLNIAAISGSGLSEEKILEHLNVTTTQGKKCKGEGVDSCAICLSEYKENEKMATLQCGHGFHVECIKSWLLLKNVCTMCRVYRIDRID